jgi:hypothetical protein
MKRSIQCVLPLIGGLVLCACCGCANSHRGHAHSKAATSAPAQFAPARQAILKKGGIIEVGFYRIPADKEFVYDGPVEIRARQTIVIDGALRALQPRRSDTPGHDIVLSSKEGIIVRGEIIGGEGYDALRIGEDGGDAGRLVLHAPVIITSKPLIGPQGGDGGPGGGDGGRGGSVYILGNAHGPYFFDSDAGQHPSLAPDAKGGRGGRAGHGIASEVAEFRKGGTGGGGGAVTTGGFEEAPWMVQYRYDYQLSEDEIREAEAEGRTGIDVLDPR